MIFIKFSAIIAVLILNISINLCQKPDRSVNQNNFHKNWKFSSCDKNNVDECSQVLFLYGYPDLDKIIARNEQQVRPYCTEMRKAHKCVTDWGKNCLKTRILKQILSMFMSGAGKSRKQLCSSAGIKRHFENLDCIFAVINEQHKCMHQFIKDIDSVNQASDDKYWLQQGCCYTTKWQKCYKDVTKKHCNKKGIEYLNWIIEPFLESLDIACKPEWKVGSIECTKAWQHLPKTNTTRKTPKSLLLPLYQMFTSFLGNGDIQDIFELNKST